MTKEYKKIVEYFLEKRAAIEEAKRKEIEEAAAAAQKERTDRFMTELHEQLARLYTFDVESIGSIDGTAFANRIKKIAENFAKSPIREGRVTVPMVIYLLGGLIKIMPEFKEEKHE